MWLQHTKYRYCAHTSQVFHYYFTWILHIFYMWKTRKLSTCEIPVLHVFHPYSRIFYMQNTSWFHRVLSALASCPYLYGKQKSLKHVTSTHEIQVLYMLHISRVFTWNMHKLQACEICVFDMYFMCISHVLHAYFTCKIQVDFPGFELIGQLPLFEGVSAVYCYWLLGIRVKLFLSAQWLPTTV